MPRGKEKNAMMRNDAQSKIMDTAITVFAKKGFSDTSINAIAKEADISVGLMYRYFKSKQDLFDKIIDMAVGGINEMTEMLNNAENPQDAIRSFIQEMIDIMKDDGFMKLNMMMMQGLISQDHFAFSKLLSADEKMIDAICELIKKGQSQGVFDDGDVDSKAHLLVATVQGMTIMKSAFKEKHIPPTVDDIMAFLIKGRK